MKPILRKELIEVEAGDAAGNAGETRANAVCVLVADRFELGVNLAATATFANDALKLGGGGCSDSNLGTVVQQNLQLLDVVDSLATQQGMRAAGIVADHPTDGAAIVRGRVRRKG